jgi:hypothetical protein
MKIAIYGDSFADPTWNSNSYDSWPELLTNDHDITNLAKEGSSLWWSYKKFKDNHNKFDVNIFVATIHSRIYLERLDKHLNINQNSWPVASGVNLGKIYYQEFYSNDRESTFHQFLINDVLSTPNTIYIPAFEECVLDGNLSLNHLALLEYAHYGIIEYIGKEDRKCHLTKENNWVVYKKILHAISERTNKFLLTQEDFVQPTDVFNYYFNKS